MIVRVLQGSSVPLVDNGPLWCLVSGTPPAGHLWRVISLGVTGVLMDSAINPSGPISGCFVVPQNIPPETINDVNQAGFASMVRLMSKRFQPMSMSIQSPQSGNFPGGGNAGNGQPNYFLQAVLTEVSIVPESCTILAAFVSNIGLAAPGPGAGSQCNVIAVVLEGLPHEFAR